MDDFQTNLLIETFAAALAALSTFGVAVVAFLLTRDLQRESFDKEARRAAQAREKEERRQHAAIRLALNLEVDNNLAALTDFWERVTGPGGSVGVVGRRLLDAAVPVWSTGVWQGAAATIAIALTSEELSASYRLYSSIGGILETQRRLYDATQRDIAEYAADPGTPTILGRPEFGVSKFQGTRNFGAVAKALIPDLDTKISTVLDRGNPVPVALESQGPDA